jgi:hypothetical protein
MNEHDAKSQQEATKQLLARHRELFREVITLVRSQMDERGISLPKDRKGRQALFEAAIGKVAETRQLDADTVEAMSTLCSPVIRAPRLLRRMGVLPEQPEPEEMAAGNERQAFERTADQLYSFLSSSC